MNSSMRPIVRTLLLILLGTGLHPQPISDPTETYGTLNGVGWRKSGDEGHIRYVQGLTDGVMMAFGRARGTPCEQSAFATVNNYMAPQTDISVGQIVENLDALYRDTANRLVAVADAMEITNARKRGVPEEVLSRRLQRARQLGEASRSSQQK